MASDKPSPVLLDAVKAQASKLRETKNALDARQKELDTLRAELEARNAALENQATRLKSERDEFAQERDQVIAARTSMDKDIAGIRMERDKASAEERRVQDWARTLNEREKGVKDREEVVKRLEHDLTDHLKESERKIQALVKREEELIKLQNERLNALEAREREMLKISEEMYSRQKESAAQHDSFVDLQTTLKEELISLASEREKLAVKEKSLLEAEKYITAALEASGIEVPDEPETKAPPPPPASATDMRPPRPPAAQAPPPAPMEPLRDEIFEEEPSEAKPRVSRADALERMTKALETAKRARDTGRNVSEIRKVLKQARAAFEGGDY